MEHLTSTAIASHYSNDETGRPVRGDYPARASARTAEARWMMDQDGIFRPSAPAGAAHRLALPPGPLTFASIWTTLPPARREAARDYVAQGRVRHRCRRGHAHVAVLHGHQDTYHVYCEDGADGWQVGCTCGRRLPCAHVGAVLFALAQEPGTFITWTPAAAWGADGDWAWDWARGGSFPWGAAFAGLPLREAPAAPDAPLPDAVAALGSTAARDLSGQLLAVVTRAHPGWWEHPAFARALAEGFGRLAQRALPAAVLVEWMRQLAEEPHIPCAALFDSAAADDPAVAAAWQSALWEVATAHALCPRPSQALAARALLGLPRLAAAHRGVVSQFGWALPTATAQATLLMRQGRAAEAWWHLSQRAPSPDAAGDPFRERPADPYRHALERLAKAAVTGGPDPGAPTPGESDPLTR